MFENPPFENPSVNPLDRPPQGYDLREEHDEAARGDLHNTTLYNQGREDGELTDPATGLPANQNDYLEGTDDIDKLSESPLDLKKDTANDLATEWLRQNDPDFTEE